MISGRLVALLVLAMLGLLAGALRAQEDLDEDLPRPRMVEPAPTPAPGFAAGVATPRILQWAAGRRIIVMVPEAWDATAERGPHGSLGIELKPRAGRLFTLAIDAIPLTVAERGRMDAEGLRLLVENDGHRMLPHATETSLRLERVMGATGHGYVYSLTDSRMVLPPGEYRHVTAGAYVAGDLLLVLSLEHNDASGAVKSQVLEVLKSVRPMVDE